MAPAGVHVLYHSPITPIHLKEWRGGGRTNRSAPDRDGATSLL